MVKTGKRKNKKNTLSELMPVLIVALIGYVLLSGGFGLFTILGSSNTVALFDTVPASDSYPSGKAYVDTEIVKVSDNSVKVEIDAYSDITRFGGRDTIACDANSACVFANRVGSGNLVKVFVVDVDNSTYLETIVSDEGVLSNGKPLGLFAWDSLSDYMVSTANMNTAEGKATMSGFDYCEGLEGSNCWKLPLGVASKTISLPAGNFVVEIRALNIKDLKMANIGDIENILRRDPDYLQSYLDRRYSFDSSYYWQDKDDLQDSDYLNLLSAGFLTQVYTNDGGSVYGIFRESDFANSVSREDMVLVDSLTVNMAVSEEPPLIHLPEPPEEPPEVEDEQVPGLLDGFLAGVNTWLNGIWRMFIGIFYV